MHIHVAITFNKELVLALLLNKKINSASKTITLFNLIVCQISYDEMNRKVEINAKNNIQQRLDKWSN